VSHECPHLCRLSHALARYSTVEAAEPSEFIQPPVAWTKGHISRWLYEQVKDLNKGKDIASFSDLFENGFDRLVLS